MACSAALSPCSEARQCSMILALTWASPSIVSLLKSGGGLHCPYLGPSLGSPPLKLSQPQQQQEADHCMAQPCPDLVQSAVPDRPGRRSTGRGFAPKRRPGARVLAVRTHRADGDPKARISTRWTPLRKRTDLPLRECRANDELLGGGMLSLRMFVRPSVWPGPGARP